MDIRKTDFAGTWYPGTETECLLMIESFMDASVPHISGKGVLGGIVPHAGWYYSGNIAFNVINCLQDNTSPDVIAIFGRHLHQGSSAYIMKDGYWDTPLGSLKIETGLAEKLMEEFKFTLETASRHEQDNTIELQLPFIKYLFPDVSILPVGVPPKASSIKIGERTAELAKEMGKKLFVIGSTDLTHYGYNYGFMPKGTGSKALEWVKNENDKRMIDLILDMDPEAILSEAALNLNACCSGAVAAAVGALKKIGGLTAEKLNYRTSYDVRPDDSFVGYAGIVFNK
jgi:MEMO1 family protein